MYDRERQIKRAIDSCLNQKFRSFEVIVVDDGSTDKSVDVVRGYSDDRVKLICHPVNRGACPARNTGVSAAKGEWMVFLDSDDELIRDSLTTIYNRSSELSGDISRIEFMGKLDSGLTSPDPPLRNEFWDYIGYIKWLEECHGRRQDSLPIIRRGTFTHVKFPDYRSNESPYHLNFMKKFNAMSFPDVVALYHQDAENQLTRPDTKRIFEYARDQVNAGESLLHEHGKELKCYAPMVYRMHISGLATLSFIMGNRLKGFKYSVLSLSDNVFSIRTWVILLFGFIGSKPIAWLKCYRISLLSKPR